MQVNECVRSNGQVTQMFVKLKVLSGWDVRTKVPAGQSVWLDKGSVWKRFQIDKDSGWTNDLACEFLN